MIQNVTGGPAPQPQQAASTDRDALRWNGAQGRGFAFGKLKREPIVDTVETAPSESAKVPTYSNTASGTSHAGSTQDTNAVAVTKDGSVNINVTISAGGGSGGKGVTHFEEGGSYSFSLSNHPGAKYRIVGLDGGNGVTNPNNIKGTIFLNGAEIKFGDIKDKVGEFLKKRDEIGAKADDKPEKAEKAKRAGDITLDDLKAFNLLGTPDVGVLNIHDDRFDHSKFTDKEVLSLKVAAKLATQDPLNPIREEKDEEKGRGLKLGHQKDGFATYGNGLKLGHDKAPGILALYA